MRGKQTLEEKEEMINNLAPFLREEFRRKLNKLFNGVYENGTGKRK